MVTAIKGNDTSTFGGNIDVPQIITDAPAFSAYQSSNQSISSATYTKVQLDTEDFDTNNNFDNATNYRFTPTVAGYYQFNGSLRNDASTSPTRVFINIYKNGALYKRGVDFNIAGGFQATISTLIYLNGTTDYVELYAYIVATTAVIGTSDSRFTYFDGFLARAV